MRGLLLLTLVGLSLASYTKKWNNWGAQKWLHDEFSSSLEKFKTRSPDDDPLDFVPHAAKPLLPFARHLNMDRPKKIPRHFQTKDVICSLCVSLGNQLLDQFHNGASLDDIKAFVVGICTTFNIADDVVCKGAIDNYAGEIFYIANQRPDLTADDMCAVLIGKCGNWEQVNSWTVEVDSNKPPIETPVLPPADAPKSKILQISDIHLDLTYTIGNNKDCGRPTCCSNNTGPAPTPESAAGYWGSYTCDLPHWTFKDMLLHIRETHLEDIDYIMLTGDNPAHDVWGQSREANLAHSKKVIDLVKEVFPDRQIFPSLGNHESFPCNSFPMMEVEDSEFNPQWFYDAISEYFSDWLPEQAIESMRTKGWYSVEVKPGFRIIAVNSNMCVTYNFWLLYNWVDPNEQLKWLAEELLKAEQAGERVHILSHGPPGNSDCLSAWGREYNKIVSRFENTITAQFYGHTHNDEFIVFYDADTNDRATNIGFVAPSVTTYTDLNPAYRMYTIDGSKEGGDGQSRRVLNSETYIFSLDEANASGEDERPVYFKLYDALEDLEMNSLFPADWDAVARRLANDDEYYQKFFRYYNQDSNGDADSRREVICSLVKTSYIDDRKCIEIMGPE